MCMCVVWQKKNYRLFVTVDERYYLWYIDIYSITITLQIKTRILFLGIHFHRKKRLYSKTLFFHLFDAHVYRIRVPIDL